jgi:hypothetical protein
LSSAGTYSPTTATTTDLGGDWFVRRTDTDKRRDHLIRQLQDLGYGVKLTKVA